MSIRSNAGTPEKYFTEISDAQLMCLAMSHRWPELIPGQRIPKGMNVVPDERLGGCMQITEYCDRDCDVWRTSTTLPGYRFNREILYQYEYGGRWIVRPEHLELTPRMFRAELYRRMIW
jgi:hypothetical protein